MLPTPRPPLIHIGFPKTASTWLQESLFQQPESGFCAPWGLPSGEAIEQFVITNGFSFDPAAAREVFAPGLEEAQRRGLVPVLSQETLVGDQVSGKYWGREAAARIHATFPGARILLLIREQRGMILSCYREYLKNGGTASLGRYMGSRERRPGFGPICQLDYLEYHHLLDWYRQHFGAEQLLALPFEALRRDPQAVARRIVQFVGIHDEPEVHPEPLNRGSRGFTLRLRRRINRFCKPPYFAAERLPLGWRLAMRLSGWCDRWLPEGLQQRAEAAFAAEIEAAVGDRFRESNRRSGELLGVDLEEYGYRV